MVSLYLICNAGTLKQSMTYGPSIPYMECKNLVNGSPNMYNMITVNELWSLCTLYGIMGTLYLGPPHMYDMICGSLITVNDI